MVSFDAKSLFTNVPIIAALTCFEKRLKEIHYTAFEIKELIALTCTCKSDEIIVHFKNTSINSLRACDNEAPQTGVFKND